MFLDKDVVQKHKLYLKAYPMSDYRISRFLRMTLPLLTTLLKTRKLHFRLRDNYLTTEVVHFGNSACLINYFRRI